MSIREPAVSFGDLLGQMEAGYTTYPRAKAAMIRVEARIFLARAGTPEGGARYALATASAIIASCISGFDQRRRASGASVSIGSK
jgi:hypothetical protein